ncbi:MAG: tryptophan--tRNA ligase [Candidatus Saccharimonadales bacterium]
MAKPVILTGLRANNDLHIGNYFGALLPLIDMAKNKSDDYQINLFVPDLHSFTTPIDFRSLQSQVMHNLKLFLAAGLPLGHPNIHVYRQSYIPAHSELTWILDCFTGFGEMNRMTQFKDKSRSASRAPQFRQLSNKIAQATNTAELELGKTHNIVKLPSSYSVDTSVGLFNYPVLMAADILLYSASYVPVGDDQSQHLEFARDIAERMNNRFGELFVMPEPVKKQHEFFGKEQGLRIKDLADPNKKMSKSDDSSKGVIFLSDEPKTAAKKVISATSDSLNNVNYDFEKQPGVSNLLQILALLSGKNVSGITSQWQGKTSYGELKSQVAKCVESFLSGFQAKLAQVDEPALLAKLEKDEQAMNQIAGAKLLQVQRAVGLRP